MIPKVIHYCWFGYGKKPKLATKCIESWRRFFPDYEIKEWNEDNFDVNIIPYTAEAYARRKYAFVSDYARFWILYHYGGVVLTPMWRSFARWTTSLFAALIWGLKWAMLHILELTQGSA